MALRERGVAPRGGVGLQKGCDTRVEGRGTRVRSQGSITLLNNEDLVGVVLWGGVWHSEKGAWHPGEARAYKRGVALR